MSSFFSYCIVLIACLCLHEAARLMPFKLGYNAQCDKSWAWKYFIWRYVFSLWERYERWSFYISKRYYKANNKYLKPYEPKQEPKDITYLDANNLYSYVVSKLLATVRFKRIDLEEFDWNKYISNSLKDFVLEVDLVYHKELRELHNDYLLATD